MMYLPKVVLNFYCTLENKFFIKITKIKSTRKVITLYMDTLDKIILSAASPNNITRHIAEVALQNIIEKQPIDVLKALTIKFPNNELAFAIGNFIIKTYEVLEIISDENKSIILNWCFQGMRVFNFTTACICLANILIKEVQKENFHNFVNLLDFRGNNENSFYIANLRTIGIVCEEIDFLPEEYSVIIYDLCIKCIEYNFNYRICLQTLIRSMKHFLGRIEPITIGNVLYEMINKCLFESLEAIYEYSYWFRESGFYINYKALCDILEIEDSLIINLIIEILKLANEFTDKMIAYKLSYLLSKEEYFEVCADYFMSLFLKEETMEIWKYLASIHYSNTYIMIALIGCLPHESSLVEQNVGWIIDFVFSQDQNFKEIALWSLSNVITPKLCGNNFLSLVLKFTDFIAPSMDIEIESMKIKVYSAWCLLKIIRNRLTQEQIVYIIEKFIFISGDQETIFAIWAVICELIQMSEHQYLCKNLICTLTNLLRESCFNKISCILEALCEIFSITHNAHSEKICDKIVYFIIKCSFSKEIGLTIKILSEIQKYTFEKYLNVCLSYLEKNSENYNAKEIIESLFIQFPVCQVLKGTSKKSQLNN